MLINHFERLDLKLLGRYVKMRMRLGFGIHGLYKTGRLILPEALYYCWIL